MATTNVFIDPVRMRYSLEVVFLKKTLEIVAAWAVPMPGSNEQSGEMSVVDSNGFLSKCFFIFGDIVFCLGMVGLVFIECIIVALPKSPVSSGSNGCVMLADVETTPSVPARRKIMIAQTMLCFSFRINVIEIMRRSGAMIFSRMG